MSVIEYIIIFTFIGSIGSLCGGIALLSHEKLMSKIAHFLASFAAGTLLGTAFFDLLPEALDHDPHQSRNVLFWTLIGILLFFMVERLIHWYHHHESEIEEKQKSKTTLPLIIGGDTIHNFLDGMVIAATFLVNIPLGVVTTLAVAAHEIPQEIGDFGLMFHKGLAKKKIIWVNIVSAAVSFLGAFLVIIFGNFFDKYVPIFLSITAGFFIYIAASDLIPEIHLETRRKHMIMEVMMLLLGVCFVWIAVHTLPRA